MGSLVAELAEKLSSATNNFDIDSGTIYVNTSADTVGIGTTTPGSKLDVQGTMQVGVDDTGHDVKFFGATAGAYLEWDESADELEIRGGAATPGKLLLSTAETTVVDGNKLGQIDFQAPAHSGTGDALLVGASIYAEADATFSSSVNATELVFATGASEAATEKMRITSDGKVGINTAAPAAELHLRGDAAEKRILRLQNNNDTDNDLTLIDIVNTDGGATYKPVAFGCKTINADDRKGSFVVGVSDLDEVDMSTDIRMTITNEGNVGIGTTGPNVGSFSSGSRVLTIEGDAQNDFGVVELVSTDTTSTNRIGELRFINKDGTSSPVAQAGIRVFRDGANDASAMAFYTEVTGGSFLEKMRIDSAGNVGIGTTAPETSLHVGATASGTAGVAGKPMIVASTLATVYDGTSAGSWQGLKVNNSDGTSNRTATGITFDHRTSSSGVAAIVSTSAAADRADIRFITRGSGGIGERMRIDDAGNVGIASTAPTEKLDVTGTARASAIVGRGTAESSSGVASDTFCFEGVNTMNGATYHGAVFASKHADSYSLLVGVHDTSFTTAPSLMVKGDGNVGIGTLPNRAGFSSGLSNARVLTVKAGGSGDNPGVLELVCQDATGTGRHGEIRFINMNGTSSAHAQSSIRAVRAASDNDSSSLSFWTSNSGSMARKLDIGHSGNVTPGSDNVGKLGDTSLRWHSVYAVNGSIQTSDRNEKTEIEENKLGLDFINALKTKSYKFRENNFGGTHYGLLAQDIEDVLDKFNIKVNEYAPVTKDKIIDENKNERYRYGLSYTEFLAPIIKSVQELSAKNDALSAEIASLKNTG